MVEHLLYHYVTEPLSAGLSGGEGILGDFSSYPGRFERKTSKLPSVPQEHRRSRGVPKLGLELSFQGVEPILERGSLAETLNLADDTRMVNYQHILSSVIVIASLEPTNLVAA